MYGRCDCGYYVHGLYGFVRVYDSVDAQYAAYTFHKAPY